MADRSNTTTDAGVFVSNVSPSSDVLAFAGISRQSRPPNPHHVQPDKFFVGHNSDVDDAESTVSTVDFEQNNSNVHVTNDMVVDGEIIDRDLMQYATTLDDVSASNSPNAFSSSSSETTVWHFDDDPNSSSVTGRVRNDINENGDEERDKSKEKVDDESTQGDLSSEIDEEGNDHLDLKDILIDKRGHEYEFLPLHADGPSAVMPGEYVACLFTSGWELGRVANPKICNKLQRKQAKDMVCPVLVYYESDGLYWLLDMGLKEATYLTKDAFERIVKKESTEEDENIKAGAWCLLSKKATANTESLARIGTAITTFGGSTADSPSSIAEPIPTRVSSNESSSGEESRRNNLNARAGRYSCRGERKTVCKRKANIAADAHPQRASSPETKQEAALISKKSAKKSETLPVKAAPTQPRGKGSPRDLLFRCPICFEDFDYDRTSFQDKRLSNLPVQSAACSHKVCCTCLAAMQVAGGEGGSKLPKWRRCPVCQIKTSFNAVDMPVDIFACDCMRRICDGRSSKSTAKKRRASPSTKELNTRLAKKCQKLQAECGSASYSLLRTQRKLRNEIAKAKEDADSELEKTEARKKFATAAFVAMKERYEASVRALVTAKIDVCHRDKEIKCLRDSLSKSRQEVAQLKQGQKTRLVISKHRKEPEALVSSSVAKQ